MDLEIVRPETTIIPVREPRNDAERDSYWFKAYKSMEEAAQRAQARVNDLEKILSGYDVGFGAARDKMENQDRLMEGELGNHNGEMQEMGQELARLKAKVRSLGGTDD